MVSLVFLCGGGCVFPLCVHCPCRALVLPYTWRRVGLVKSLPLISLVGSPRQTIKYSPGCSLEMGRNRIYGYALWIPFVIPQGYIYFIYVWNMVVFPELINNCWIKEKVSLYQGQHSECYQEIRGREKCFLTASSNVEYLHQILGRVENIPSTSGAAEQYLRSKAIMNRDGYS